LNYKIEKLLSTGFSLRNNSALEIDDILRVCDKPFGVKN
jgi:hypothetical protein